MLRRAPILASTENLKVCGLQVRFPTSYSALSVQIRQCTQLSASSQFSASLFISEIHSCPPASSNMRHLARTLRCTSLAGRILWARAGSSVSQRWSPCRMRCYCRCRGWRMCALLARMSSFRWLLFGGRRWLPWIGSSSLFRSGGQFPCWCSWCSLNFAGLFLRLVLGLCTRRSVWSTLWLFVLLFTKSR